MALRNEGVGIDDLFEVLSDPRRRFLIACLHEHSDPMALADAAAELTHWECDTPEDRISKDQVRSRYAVLYHVHVPKLADVGLVEYDRVRKTVTLAGEFDEIVTSLPLPSIG